MRKWLLLSLLLSGCKLSDDRPNGDGFRPIRYFGVKFANGNKILRVTNQEGHKLEGNYEVTGTTYTFMGYADDKPEMVGQLHREGCDKVYNWNSRLLSGNMELQVDLISGGCEPLEFGFTLTNQLCTYETTDPERLCKN